MSMVPYLDDSSRGATTRTKIPRTLTLVGGECFPAEGGLREAKYKKIPRL